MIGDLTAKRLFLQVVEPGRPLYVGECLLRRILQPFVNLTADQCPFELADKLFQVMFYHPIQIHQFTIDIVNDFDLAGCLKKIKRSCSAEWLHIAGMGRK
ncbi:Uncharacterised protein [Enterobacter asburiae]|uniref:Uncharacterized protein n=1 Tax=Enterobacter asburiae TaxID=61645 RepID=A0A376FEP8_ENTAS|nr:Uncharacterised protein [Enterobacter asburiae]